MLKRYKLRSAGLVALALLYSSCCTPGPITSLPVPLHPQETSMWCWAASGQMAMHYLSNDVPQCTQANNRFGVTNCPCDQCGPNPVQTPPCVIGGWPEFDKYGFTFKRTSDAALSWDALTKELSQDKYCGKTPVAFSWHWAGGGGHMMVAYGYVTVSATDYVAIHDPWAPCAGDTRIIPYTGYVQGTGYTHWDDFHQIRKK